MKKQLPISLKQSKPCLKTQSNQNPATEESLDESLIYWAGAPS